MSLQWELCYRLVMEFVDFLAGHVFKMFGILFDPAASNGDVTLMDVVKQYLVFCVFRVPLTSNYIAVRCKNAGVYQYAVAFSPEVDSLRMRYKLLEDQRMRNIIGDVRAFDGRILFLPIQLQQVSISCRRWTTQCNARPNQLAC